MSLKALNSIFFSAFEATVIKRITMYFKHSFELTVALYIIQSLEKYIKKGKTLQLHEKKKE